MIEKKTTTAAEIKCWLEDTVAGWNAAPTGFVWDCFFFQAEVGIRDLTVTGVQTCALPIWKWPSASARRQFARPRGARTPGPLAGRPAARRPRSEERRVGKECRSRWSP